MKKLNLSLSFVAVLLGVAFAFVNAFPAKAGNNRPLVSWFAYNGSGSVTDPANYTEISGDPSCTGTISMCAIEATVGTGSKPVITTGLQTEINNDLTHHSGSAHVSLQDQ